jgi:hypothetical protein
MYLTQNSIEDILKLSPRWNYIHNYQQLKIEDFEGFLIETKIKRA